MKRTVTVADTNENNWRNKELAFENNASFRSCISKINNTFIDSEEYCYANHNLLEYGDNYSLISGSLWNYKDEMNNDVNENNGDN